MNISLYMVLGLVLYQHAYTIVTKLQNQQQTLKTVFTDDFQDWALFLAVNGVL